MTFQYLLFKHSCFCSAFFHIVVSTFAIFKAVIDRQYFPGTFCKEKILSWSDWRSWVLSLFWRVCVVAGWQPLLVVRFVKCSWGNLEAGLSLGAWSNPLRPTHSVASPLTSHQDSHSRPFFSPPSSPVQRCSEIPAMIAASSAPTPRESRPGFFTDLAANHGLTFCEARRAASSTAVKQAVYP